MKMLKCFVLVCLALWALPFLACAAEPLQPLPLDVAASGVTTVQEAALSPDGRYLAYVLSGSRLRILERASGQTFESDGLSPAWSPDGRYLAFYSGHTGTPLLWLWNAQTKAFRALSTVPLQSSSQGHGHPVWVPDGKTVLVAFSPANPPAAPGNESTPSPKNPASAPGAPKVSVYTFSPTEQAATPATSSSSDVVDTTPGTIAWINTDWLSDLGLVDVGSGQIRYLARNVRPAWYTVAPNGRFVAYMQMNAWVMNTQQTVFDLDIIDLDSGAQRTLVPQMMSMSANAASLSPDSAQFAYITSGPLADNCTYLVSAASGTPHKVTQALQIARPFANGIEMPLWDPQGRWFVIPDHLRGKVLKVTADGGQITPLDISNADLSQTRFLSSANRQQYWSSDGGRSLIVSALDKNSHANMLCRLDLIDGKIISALRDPGKDYSIYGISLFPNKESAIPIAASNSDDPGNLWLTNEQLQAPQRVTDANPALQSVKLGKVEVISWTSLNGEPLHGALMLPANYEKGQSYPLVVRVYGTAMGSELARTFGFEPGEFNMQVLASRGYAVLYPDIPVHLDKHEPLQDVYDSVMPGVDKTIALGIADPKRLFVIGQSFGGYNVIGLITKTDRFAGAISTSAAPTNLFEGYSLFDDGSSKWAGYYETGQGAMGCTPWEDRDRYLQNSPFFFLDKVKTPLLLERGMTDSISLESPEVFVALRRLGKEVTLVEYDNEDHSLSRPADTVDFWTKTLDFLKSHS